VTAADPTFYWLKISSE